MKYLYAYISFFRFNKKYNLRYLVDDSYKKGDYVLIDHLGTKMGGIILSIKKYSEDKVPYPLNKMKHVIKKISLNEYLDTYKNISIYNYIMSNIDNNNNLDPNFRLNSLEPGSIDGFNLYHFNTDELVEEDKLNQLEEILFINNQDKIKDVIYDLDYTFNNSNTTLVPYIDKIVDYIDNNKDRLSYDYLFNLAYQLFTLSKEIESMKLALFIFYFFKVDDFNSIGLIYDLIRIGKCEEFTYYVYNYSLRDCNNYNSIMFREVKLLNGWGKIHLISFIDIDTKEILDYMLSYGCSNRINNGYNAPILADKLDICNILKTRDLNYTELCGLLEIIVGLISRNSPLVDGLSDINNGDILLDIFINLYDKYYMYIDYLCVLKDIYYYNNNDLIINLLCDDRTIKVVCDSIINGNINDFYNSIDICNLNKDFDYSDIVFDRYKSNVLEYYFATSYLLDSKRREDTINLLDSVENISLYFEEAMDTGDLIDDNNIYKMLEELYDYPNIGIKYIIIGLNSKYKSVRGLSLEVIDNWYNLSNNISDDIIDELYNLDVREPCDDLYEVLEKLIVKTKK